MPKDRRERIKLALDITVSFGKLLGSHVLGLKYDSMVIVVAPIVRYDPSLIFETLGMFGFRDRASEHVKPSWEFSPRQKFQGIIKKWLSYPYQTPK